MDQDQLNDNLLTILGGCHSLISNQGKLLGDPIERAVFENFKWRYSNNDKVSSFKNKVTKMVHHFPFQSELKRMSTVVSYLEDGMPRDFRVLVKGAPETVQKLLKEVPKNYEKVYRTFAKKGFRILALAYKTIDTVQDVTRKQAECDLNFEGFILFDSPLKKDTKKHIDSLTEANYKIVMITGDSELTAANVSERLELGPKDHLFLAQKSENEFVWEDADKKEHAKYSEEKTN